MATKNSADQPEQAASAPSAPGDIVTLKDFCIRLSETVRRPALIGGFYADELAKGTASASVADLKSRYEAFVNKPV